MKDIIKALKLLGLGLLSAVFIYPLLHEFGHCIFAFCSGVKVEKFKLFPLPYVLCNFDQPNIIGVVLTGLGGLLFPFITVLFLSRKWFATWFVCFVIEGICVLSFVISIISLILFQMGRPIEDEDITKIMQYAPQYVAVYYMMFVLLMLISIVRMAKSHPIKWCLIYFDIKK